MLPRASLLARAATAAAAVAAALSAAAAAAADGGATAVVSYGSAIKLAHAQTDARLHSHEIPYGSGSRQQSVTTLPGAGDVNSYWLVKGAHRAAARPAGAPVRCGDTVRLQHAATGRNLHSHLHQAPMSRDLEVSAYRDEEEAEDGGRWFDGDTGDNWVVTCEARGELWARAMAVSMKHVDTGAWLSSSSRYQFGQPIHGQMQVCSAKRKSKDTTWKVAEGIFMHAPEKKVA